MISFSEYLMWANGSCLVVERAAEVFFRYAPSILFLLGPNSIVADVSKGTLYALVEAPLVSFIYLTQLIMSLVDLSGHLCISASAVTTSGLIYFTIE